ncbi:MAG: hypothetical protein PVG32_09925 [Anaerolineales bacterium]
MSHRLSLLTPLAYFKLRLAGALRKRVPALTFLGMCLVIAAFILLWPTDRRIRAAGSFHPAPADLSISSITSTPADGIAESETSPTPTFPPAVIPTPITVPDSGLIWSKKATAAYLWESPEGKILTPLPNGTAVKLLDERQFYGNMPWIRIQSPKWEGWILQTQTFRTSDLPVAYVAIEEGTYLRDRPRGGVQKALPVGTPIMGFMGTQDAGGRTWVQVKLLDGAVGWVVEVLLAEEQPALDSPD